MKTILALLSLFLTSFVCSYGQDGNSTTSQTYTGLFYSGNAGSTFIPNQMGLLGPDTQQFQMFGFENGFALILQPLSLNIPPGVDNIDFDVATEFEVLPETASSLSVGTFAASSQPNESALQLSIFGPFGEPLLTFTATVSILQYIPGTDTDSGPQAEAVNLTMTEQERLTDGSLVDNPNSVDVFSERYNSDVPFDLTPAVPEPGTYALFAGLAGLAFAAFFKRRHKG